MKQNFTVRHGALDGVEAFLSVAQHRSFRRAAARTRRDAVGDQPGGPRARGARRRGALHPHHAQRRPDRSRRALPCARQARLRGACRRQRGRARPRTAAGRTAAPLGAARGRADPAGAADRVLLPGLSRGRGGDRRQRGAGRPRGRGVRRRHPARPVHRRRHGRGAADAAVPASSSSAAPTISPAATGPSVSDDLRHHACVRMRRSNGAIAPWSFVNDNGRAIEIAVSGPLIANDFPTMLGAAVEGVGLAQVPEPDRRRGGESGKARARAGASSRRWRRACSSIIPAHRQMMPKLRAFIDHVKSHSRAARSGRTKAP